MTKEINLPVHHIDASVFLELFIKPKKSRLSYHKECREYLQYKIGKKYFGKLSLLALGEIIKTIMAIKKDLQWEAMQERNKIFSDLILILQRKNIEFWSPQFGCLRKALEIGESNQYEPADMLHLSCASQDKDCKVFVTLEEGFIRNKHLEKSLNIKIRPPSDF